MGAKISVPLLRLLGFHAYANLGEYLKSGNKSCYMKLSWGIDDDEHSCDWSNQVPGEIQSMIVERLDLAARACVCSVSSSWRSIGVQKYSHGNQFPWMSLPLAYNSISEYLSFFDMVSGRVYKFTLPRSVQGGHCIGSSKGWLLFDMGDKLYLLNPISQLNIQLQLPFIDGLDFDIYKIELSSEDASTCIISMVLESLDAENDTILGVRKLNSNDEGWSYYKPDADTEIHDVLFFKGMLYVIIRPDDDDDIHNVTISDFTMDEITLKVVMLPSDRDICAPQQLVQIEGHYGLAKNSIVFPYLVECQGKLLIVCKISDAFVDEDGDYEISFVQESKFTVHRMDETSGSLEKLSSIDDKIIFVGVTGSSVSISAKKIDGVKGNCIYFLEDIAYGYSKGLCISRGSGMFCLDNAKITRFYPSFGYYTGFCWFTPSLS